MLGRFTACNQLIAQAMGGFSLARRSCRWVPVLSVARQPTGRVTLAGDQCPRRQYRMACWLALAAPSPGRGAYRQAMRLTPGKGAEAHGRTAQACINDRPARKDGHRRDRGPRRRATLGAIDLRHMEVADFSWEYIAKWHRRAAAYHRDQRGYSTTFGFSMEAQFDTCNPLLGERGRMIAGGATARSAALSA